MKKYLFAFVACIIYLIIFNVAVVAIGKNVKDLGTLWLLLFLGSPILGIWKFVLGVFSETTSPVNVNEIDDVKIKNKYKELIRYFDTFDLHNKPKVLANQPNLYKMGWMGSSTIMNISLSETDNMLNIICDMDYNYENLKKRGLDVSKLTNVKTHKTFKFDSNLSQAEIIQSFSVDFENLLETN